MHNTAVIVSDLRLQVIAKLDYSITSFSSISLRSIGATRKLNRRRSHRTRNTL